MMQFTWNFIGVLAYSEVPEPDSSSAALVARLTRVTARLAPVLAGCLLTGCSVTMSRPTVQADNPQSAAIGTVAMHACDLIRIESPDEIDSLRQTMSALNVLLRDQRADWGVISATFDAIPSRSKRHLGLSAAMAKQYAENIGGYYDGLRRMTSGCLNALTIDPPGRRARETGQQSPPPGRSRGARRG